MDLAALLTDRATKVVVTCGSGGVGKTTTAAALALWAADAGRKVAVLTIDPARRLAQSLGLDELDNDPRRVELPADTDTDTSGELWAMMLDSRRTFDEMVAAHSTPERAEQIYGNPFYQSISTSFSGTQEYMAMEKLGKLAGTGQYDLIVVDTPPSRSALDFLDAPQRMSAFLDGRMIRLLASPGRGVLKVVGAGLTLFTRAVTAVIGGQMLADAAKFVQLFEDMFGGFRTRAEATYQLLRRPGTSFVIVAIPEPDALREAAYFTDRLQAERMPLAGLVLNRTHPPATDLTVAATEQLQQRLATGPDGDPQDELLAGLLSVHAERATTRDAELRMRRRFQRQHPGLPVREVPALPSDAHDLEALRTVGAALAGPVPVGPTPA
ncbi:ArsA family ATPase [Nakamurella sp. YIM 132084]|uniref:ArsA family ATPase n=1 Tax=Nakamurella leprariae TaxID=2803911 RepID=A0A938Y7C9_9ACTN|nr:ArsA family ATPase [Nakamurella leprariae]